MDTQEYINPKLKSWLEDMTSDKRTKREGRLVDMAKVCEKSYVHPDCKGKVSIKKILPAIWKSKDNEDLHQHKAFSKYFRMDSSDTIYDPYSTLEVMQEILDTAELEAEEVVAEGTAAMKAYFEMMYGRGRDNQIKKEEIKKLLLQYCELDTIAMAIIHSYWMKKAFDKPTLNVKAGR
jgi:hypothetical protein